MSDQLMLTAKIHALIQEDLQRKASFAIFYWAEPAPQETVPVHFVIHTNLPEAQVHDLVKEVLSKRPAGSAPAEVRVLN